MDQVQFAPGRATPVGQQFGNYLAREVLGHGASAMVLLGEHLYLQTPAAIKIPRGACHAATRHLFHMEAHLAVQLAHPSLVRVLDYGLRAGKPYLVMDYAPAGTLGQFRGSALPPELVMEYAEQIASGLDYLHARGIVHCDIKPSNLLLGREEQVLISDFGIAQLVGKGAARQRSIVMGTPAYMAPEQILGAPCFASDQYALAVVLYELLVGVPPFGEIKTHAVQQHLHVEPQSLREHGVPLALVVEEVIMRALAKDPQRRYASAGQFARALKRAIHVSSGGTFASASMPKASTLPPGAAKARAARMPRTERKTGRWSALVALCGGALVATGLIWLLSVLQYTGGQIFAALLVLWLIGCLFATAMANRRKTALVGGSIAVLAVLAGLVGHSVLASVVTALLLLVPSLAIGVSLYVQRTARRSKD